MTVIRSSRRSMALTLDREGMPLVRAPFRMSDEAVLAFVTRNLDWLARAILRYRERTAVPPPSEAEIELLRERAKRELPPKIAHYAAKMGVTPTGFRVTAAKTRFGSCSPKDSLSFSLYLMQWPDEAIDYVVVHELAHILHKNHSPAFHAEVSRILPDHKARRAILKRPPGDFLGDRLR